MVSILGIISQAPIPAADLDIIQKSIPSQAHMPIQDTTTKSQYICDKVKKIIHGIGNAIQGYRKPQLL